jgi:hypothetical protein
MMQTSISMRLDHGVQDTYARLLGSLQAAGELRPPKRMRYDECEPGQRVVHETHGAGVIVCTTAQLVVIRPDALGANVLAFPAQLRPEQFRWLPRGVSS